MFLQVLRFSNRSIKCVTRVQRCLLSTHDASGNSSYENYDKTSQTYDQYRSPIDLSTFRKAFNDVANRLQKKTTSLTLLDAGCGSGNYLECFQQEVGTIHGLEINDGMISKARAKLPNANIQQGSITEIPLEDEAVDVVITTQVLHHLETGKDQTFSNVVLASKEVFRCLKPGGAWVIQTQTPEQHVEGFWWAPLIPNAANKLATHFAPLDTLKSICRNAGFHTFTSNVPNEPLVRMDKYLDLEGPFLKGYRDADSTWSLATEDELEKGLKILRQKIDAGLAEGWMEEREALRKKIGQTTTVVVTKNVGETRRSKFPFSRSLSFSSQQKKIK
jgi:ubiquinone/menaquinone biosynthesis C-methylase UbiE